MCRSPSPVRRVVPLRLCRPGAWRRSAGWQARAGQRNRLARQGRAAKRTDGQQTPGSSVFNAAGVFLPCAYPAPKRPPTAQVRENESTGADNHTSVLRMRDRTRATRWVTASSSAMAGASRPGWPEGRSTPWSESVVPNLSRCSGLGASPTCCCKPALTPSTNAPALVRAMVAGAGQRQSSHRRSSRGGVNNPHFLKVSTILPPQHFAGWSIAVDAFGR